jgi:hypothetical protein
MTALVRRHLTSVVRFRRLLQNPRAPSGLLVLFFALVLLWWLWWWYSGGPHTPVRSPAFFQLHPLRLQPVGANRSVSFGRLLGDRETLLVGGVVPIAAPRVPPPACRLRVVIPRSASAAYACRFVHETWESDHHDKPLTSFVWFFSASSRVPAHAREVWLELAETEAVAVAVALPAPPPPQHFLSACVPVLQNNADPTRVLEWLQRMRRRHGVSFVRMYLPARWRPSLLAALVEGYRAHRRSLPQLELLELPDPLPMHYFGQYLTVYDCWLREATVATWTLFLDLDEEIHIESETSVALTDWLREQQPQLLATATAGFTLGSWLYHKAGIGHEPRKAQPRPVCLPPKHGWHPWSQEDAGGTRVHRPPPERCLGPPGRRKLLLQPDKMRQVQIHKAYALSGYRIVDLNTSVMHIVHYRGYVRGA